MYEWRANNTLRMRKMILICAFSVCSKALFIDTAHLMIYAGKGPSHGYLCLASTFCIVIRAFVGRLQSVATTDY